MRLKERLRRACLPDSGRHAFFFPAVRIVSCLLLLFVLVFPQTSAGQVTAEVLQKSTRDKTTVQDPHHKPPFIAMPERSSDVHSLADPDTIRIGIQQNAAYLSTTQYPAFLEQTKGKILQALNRRVEFETLSRGELAEAIRMGTVDFAIGRADFIAQARLENSLRLIASYWPSEARDVNSASSAVFIARAGRGDLNVLSQFGEKRIASVTSDSFSGYLVPLYEFSRRGYPRGYLKGLYFTGGSYKNVINEVSSGKADIGILPACVLETYAKEGKLKFSDFKVINPRRESELLCAHSTDVFPSFTVASLPKTDRAVEKIIAGTLYQMKSGKGEAQWGLPASMQSVLDVYYKLRVGPYQYLSEWSLQRFVKENAGAVTVAAILIFMIISYAAVLQMMVRRRTLALRKALEEREEVEREIASSREHIAALERTGIIGQMSSMIAHELKQPLGAINNYGHGLLRRLSRGTVDPKVLQTALEEIVGQGTRAAEIVDKVRSYAKHPNPVMEVRDMLPVLQKAIVDFRHSNPNAPQIRLECLPYSWAEVDSWEIQLAVLNLLKNATEALQGCPDPEIRVSLREFEGQWHLSVADNGLELTQEKADLFFEPLQSGKISGMGLGLSIVANIAERHKGHAVANPNRALGHGCVMTIVMPKATAPVIQP